MNDVTLLVTDERMLEHDAGPDNPEKPALFSFEERLEMAKTLVSEMIAAQPDGGPVQVNHYTGLTVDFAQQVSAAAIVRGIRNITDLASECQLAITNRQVADIETVFIITAEEFGFTSSSLIRQIAAMGGSLDRLSSIIPPIVMEALTALQQDPNRPLRRLVDDRHID